MKEERKDQIEDFGGAVLESALSLIPFVGGPAAVLANRTLGSAVQRRQARLLIELRDDLSRLKQSGLVVFDDKLAESEVFQASLQRTIRQLLETDSDIKRTLLRNALLNRVVGTDDAERFDEPLDRIRPSDVVMLNLVNEPASEAKHAQMRTLIDEQGDSRAIECKRRLIMLGLMIDVSSTDPDDGATRLLGNLDGSTRGVDRRPYWSFATDLGRDFLAYVTDPTRPGAEPAN